VWVVSIDLFVVSTGGVTRDVSVAVESVVVDVLFESSLHAKKAPIANTKKSFFIVPWFCFVYE